MTFGIPDGDQMDTEVRLGKDRLGKVNKDIGDPKSEKSKNKTAKPVKHKYGEYKNVLLSDDELKKLKTEFPNDWSERIERVSEYCSMNGKNYKNYLATIRSWAKRAKKEQNQSNQPRKEFGRSGRGKPSDYALQNRDAQDSDQPW